MQDIQVEKSNNTQYFTSVRLWLLLTIITMNYFVLDLYFETKGTPGALGGAMYMMLFWIGSIIVSTIICLIEGFKNLKAIDYILYALCTPLSTFIVLQIVGLII